MSEKIGGAKGTELDDEFVDMERVMNLNHHIHQGIFSIPSLIKYSFVFIYFDLDFNSELYDE